MYKFGEVLGICKPWTLLDAEKNKLLHGTLYDIAQDIDKEKSDIARITSCLLLSILKCLLSWAQSKFDAPCLPKSPQLYVVLAAVSISRS